MKAARKVSETDPLKSLVEKVAIPEEDWTTDEDIEVYVSLILIDTKFMQSFIALSKRT